MESSDPITHLECDASARIPALHRAQVRGMVSSAMGGQTIPTYGLSAQILNISGEIVRKTEFLDQFHTRLIEPYLPNFDLSDDDVTQYKVEMNDN